MNSSIVKLILSTLLGVLLGVILFIAVSQPTLLWTVLWILGVMIIRSFLLNSFQVWCMYLGIILSGLIIIVVDIGSVIG